MKHWDGVPRGVGYFNSLNLNRRPLIKPILGLLLAATLAGLVRPTPHKVEAYLPPKKVSHITIQPTVKTAAQVEETTPAPAAQAETPPPAPEPVVEPAAPVLAGKDAWLAASVIASSDYGYVDYIISHESGWNPNATEPTFGAHGLPQALPYSKTGCGWTDAVCQLNWANSYAVARYGSWAAAYNYWTVHHNW
jgi:hypothetical protein